jgi:hypothetical protein
VVHQYTGAVCCLVFVAWFVSGLVMAYYHSPVLDDTRRLMFAERLERWDHVLAPAAVASLRARWSEIDTLRFGSWGGRPVYRWSSADTGWGSAWADDGAPASFGPAEAMSVAQRWFGNAPVLHYAGTHGPRNQWTFAAALRSHYPLHEVDDGSWAGREIFISSRTGEVVVATSRWSRLLFYLGPGLHYFAVYPLRSHDALWRALVIAVSAIGVVTCSVGVALGVWQLRWRALGTARSVVPYAMKWMRWHHWTGLACGLVTLTFVFSGLLSMNPSDMFPRPGIPPDLRQAFLGSTPDIGALASPAAIGDDLPAAKEIEWVRMRGTAYAIALHAPGNGALYAIGAGTWARRDPFTSDELRASVEALIPARIVGAETLTEFDNYYYARHGAYLPLPVLRLRLDDADGTWWHLDPATGQLFQRSNRMIRLRRWLYNGLHSFDLQALLRHRPLWDLAIWGASLAGLALSTTGVMVSWQWLTGRSRPRMPKMETPRP